MAKMKLFRYSGLTMFLLLLSSQNAYGAFEQAFEQMPTANQQQAIDQAATPALGFPVESLSSKPEQLQQRSRSQNRLISQIAPDSSNSVGDTLNPDRIQQLRQNLLISPPVFSQPRAASPGSSLGSPSAYGAAWGNSFVGLSYASQPSNEDKADGSSVVGMGFGDPVNNLGLEVNVAIISLANTFADAGAVGFKAHKVFPEAGNLGLAVGWSNAVKWGDAKNAEDTFYGVATKSFRLRPQQQNDLPLTLSLGVGTGGFRSKGAIKAGDNAPNVFASAGLRVIPEMSLISNWTGNQLNLGVSAAPFKRLPVVFSAGASDVTSNTDGGTRFLFNVGYSYNF